MIGLIRRWLSGGGLHASTMASPAGWFVEWARGGNVGTTVTTENAMTVSAVYASVRVIAETVASLPLVVYRRVGEGKERATDVPAYSILHTSPNPDMTAFACWESRLGHVLTWGNGYLQIVRDSMGQLAGLYPLLPQANRTRPTRNAQGELVYEIRREDGQVRGVLPATEVLHLAGMGFDGVVGYSPISIARQSIGLGLAAEKFGLKFFEGGTRPGGVLQHPGRIKDGGKALRESWERMFQGVENAHRVAILEEGMTWQQIGIPPEDAQFLETRKFQLSEIARIYRVPPHMIGDLEKATFSNVEQQAIDFVVHTIRPWCVRIEQEINRKLFPAGDYFAEFLVDGLLRGDAVSRSQALQTQFLHGALSIDEWRAIENRNPLPDGLGRRHFVPVNLVPVDRVDDQRQIGGDNSEGGNV